MHSYSPTAASKNLEALKFGLLPINAGIKAVATTWRSSLSDKLFLIASAMAIKCFRDIQPPRLIIEAEIILLV